MEQTLLYLTPRMERHLLRPGQLLTFKDRDGNTDSLTFLLRAVNPVVVDNLQVTALDSNGNASSAGDILDITFTGSIDSEFGTTDVGADYGDLANWW